MSEPILVREIPRLPPRPRDAHKGTFGKVLIVAGSVGMSGAAILAGTAALRGGAGLVQLAVPEPILPIVATAQPCYMTVGLPTDGVGRVSQAALTVLLRLVESADVVVAGPGLGATQDAGIVINELILNSRLPLILDADALNVLGGKVKSIKQHAAPVVLTPHPGEFARLIGADSAAVQARRQDLALSFAREHGCILLLKGAGTIVTDGSKLFVNTTGNPGMATGGTGDVLSGLLGALLASRALPAFESAVLGAHLHGLAGDLARDRRGETSLIATDLIEHLSDSFLAATGSEPRAR